MSKQTPEAEKWKARRVLGTMEMRYLSDDMERPLSYWWQTIALPEGVSLPAAQEYAEREGLAAKRQGFLGSVRAALLNKMRLQMVHEKFEDMSRLRQLAANFHALISPVIKDGVAHYRVPPTSLEASTRTYLQLVAYVDGQRAAVAEMLEKHAPESSRVIDVAPGDGGAATQSAAITDDEATAMAMMLLKMRRGQADAEEDDS